MDPFDSYKLYNALKLHFESDYDAIKYNYTTRVNASSFFKRRDKYFFAKLAKTYPKDPEPLIQLGDYLRSQERYTEAIAQYDEAIRRVGDLKPKLWRLLYIP